MFDQKAMSTLAKSHTTYSESLKRGWKDLKRNTLPLRLIMFNNAINMEYVDIRKEKRLTAARMFNQTAMSTLAKSHTTNSESLKRGWKD